MSSGHQKRHSQYICLYQYLFKHLNKGSLVPPCGHMAGPRSPQIITLFIQSHRVFLFLVPDPCFLFWILVPRSGSSFLVPRSGHNIRFITPSPPLGKEASLNPYITRNSELLTLARAIPALSYAIILKVLLTAG